MNRAPRTVVLMAGGRGSRLGSRTLRKPKTLLEIGGVPLLGILLQQLEREGFRRAVVALGHRAHDVQAYLADREPGPLAIETHLELAPRGSIGALSEIEDLPRDFLVVNGDILTDLPFGTLLDVHGAHAGLATIAVGRAALAFPYGVVETDEGDHVLSFREKPTVERRVCLGAHAFSHHVLDLIPRRGVFGIDHLTARLLAASHGLHAFPFAGRWLDIGSPQDLVRARREMTRNRARYLAENVRA